MATNEAHEKNEKGSKEAITSARVAVIIAVISGLSSLGVALISIYPKLEENKEAIANVSDEISEKEKILLYREFPVGTIIQSVLNFDDFCEVVGQPLSHDFNSRDRAFFWSPADGRSVPGSEYSRVTSQATLIDLRGVFLRGLNKFDNNEPNGVSSTQADPDGLRTVGQLQQDGLKSHQHAITMRDGNNNDGDGDSYDTSGGYHGTDAIKTEKDGGSANETRPKNRAVYFYIKIN